MPCYDPQTGYRSRTVNPSGKRSIVFNPNQGFRDLPVIVPCGQCIGCRLDHSRAWAVRAVHESKLYEENCYLTLTYNEQSIPKSDVGTPTLTKRDPVLFLKKLRERLRRAGLPEIRYFGCGEYGENFDRPHYHVILFNFDFKDKVHETTINGNKYFSSKLLEELWTHGYSSISDVTFESAAYVGRYVTKKITGEAGLHHYNKIDYETGEVLEERMPEFPLRSMGLGKGWLEKYQTDVFPDDFVLVKGRQMKVPSYYNHRYGKDNPHHYERIKANRKKKAKAHESNNTRERLQVREEIQYRKLDLLKRNFENES